MPAPVPLAFVSIIALALAFPILGSRAAYARPAPDEPPTDDTSPAANSRDREARALYLEGENDYAAGRYEMAAEKFARAYELSGRAALLFNIANAYERMGDYEEAVRHLELYLDSPKVEDVVSIRERIKRLRSTIEANRAAVAAGSGTGEKDTDTQPDTRPDTGPEGAATSSGEQASSSTGTGIPAPETDAGNTGRTPSRGARGSTRQSGPARWPAYAFFATSGVAIAGSVTFGLASRGAADDAAAYCGTATGEPPRCLRSAESALGRERRYAVLADISTATAVVAAGVGMYFLLREGKTPARAEAQAATIAPTISPTIAPIVLPDGFGVGVAGAL